MTEIEKNLARLQTGDPTARDRLLEHSLEQCRRLARRMFRSQRDLRSIEETDDILQKALVRLHRALVVIQPSTPGAFFGLAAQQIRWVLLDLGREVARMKPVQFTPFVETPDHQDGPEALMDWCDFHEKIADLPEDERETFDLLLYQGLTQPEASDVLGVPLRTFKLRWQRARLHLGEKRGGVWPHV